MNKIAALKAYVVRFYALAKSKVTTYVALATAGFTELVSSWDSAAAMFPKWLIAEKAHIIAAASLLTVWSRIRRELSK